MRNSRRILVFLFSLLLPISPALAQSPDHLTGKVIGVADGDTVTILVNKQPVKLRLASIDCPEKKQAYGQVAKKFTSEAIFGKSVQARITDTDRYGRKIAFVFASSSKHDTDSLNYQLVANGLCWWYEQYDPKNEQLKALQDSARKRHLGLFQDSSPIPPWQFRKEKK